MQALQWTDFNQCAICYRHFRSEEMLPITISCGHTVCLKCLKKQKKPICPLDRVTIKMTPDNAFPNTAIMKVLGINDTVSTPEDIMEGDSREYYRRLRVAVENLAMLLKPVIGQGAQGVSSTCLRPQMVKKLVSIVNTPLLEEEGRLRLMKAAKSLAERTTTELLSLHQNKQELASQLWAAIRQRNCQFLGPVMQDEAIKNILKVLENGRCLSRRNIVLFVVQQLEQEFPSASKTNVGHVVQLLYRASCFNVDKKEGDSSLLQLKEEFQSYEALRREHDAQIMRIAIESGLRIGPEQYSNLLYGKNANKSQMQSILDKLWSSGAVPSGLNELDIVLQRSEDAQELSHLLPDLEYLVDKKLEGLSDQEKCDVFTLEACAKMAESLEKVLAGFVEFVMQKLKMQHGGDVTPQQLLGSKYKTGMCRDMMRRGSCPRGEHCTYAHSPEEMQRFRSHAQSTLGGPKVRGPSPVQRSGASSPVIALSKSMASMGVSGSPVPFSRVPHQSECEQNPSGTSALEQSAVVPRCSSSGEHAPLASAGQWSNSQVASVDPTVASNFDGKELHMQAPGEGDHWQSNVSLRPHYHSAGDLTNLPRELQPSGSDKSILPSTLNAVQEDDLGSNAERVLPTEVDTMREQRLKILAMMGGVPSSSLQASSLGISRFPPDLASTTYRPHGSFPNSSSAYSPSMMQHTTSQQLHDREGELRHRDMWMAAMERRIQHALATAGRDWEQQQLQTVFQSPRTFQYGHNPMMYDVNHDPGTNLYPPYFTGAPVTASAAHVLQPVHHASIQPGPMSLPHPGTPVQYPPGAVAMPTNMGIMTTVNPRLPQVVPKPMGDQGHNYNTFPVYVDPSYYSTFP